VLTELPKNGPYYVQVIDSQNHGGPAYGYRLRISQPQPDFALRMTPSSLRIRPGAIIPISVHALRKDGFAGPIEVVLKDAPKGFRLDGAVIPAGRDRVRMTLKAPVDAPSEPIHLQLEGRAQVGTRTISRRVVPAEDMMQAFLYRHLVPSQQLMVSVLQGRGRSPNVELAGEGPVRIPAGGGARVVFRTRRRPQLKEIELELSDPPEGIKMEQVGVVPQGLACTLIADDDAVKSGFADNLIFEAFREVTPRSQEGEAKKPKRRISMGVLPAVPIEVVQ
jgi:hypothetical protein